MSGLGVASGVVLDAMILGTFGMGYQTDAFFTALTIPLLLTSVLSVQCPRVLVPVFAEYFGRGEQTAAWRLLSNLVTICFVGLLGVSVVGMALSGVMVPLQIPGLGWKAISLAILLSRALFWLVLCQGLAAILQSALYAQHRFFVSASGKLVTNCFTIIVMAIWHRELGVHAAAAGMLLGSVFQLSALAVALGAHGFRYRFVFRPTDRKLLEIARSFAYPLSGHILSEAGSILQNFLGSFLGTGNLTVIRYAARITQSVAGVFLGSVVQVTFPLISKYAASNDLRAQRKTLLESMQLLGVVGVPVCIWLIVAAEPMLVLLFVRGAFSRADAALTGVIIGLMVPDIFLGRLGSIAQTLFYANKDTRTPFISTLIYTVAHSILAVLLVRLFGVIGLPIAVSLASLTFAVYLIAKVQHRFGPIGWRDLGGFALRLGAASSVAGFGFALGARLTYVGTVSDSLAKLLDFAMPTAFGVCTFILAAFVFRLIDARFFIPGRDSQGLFFDRRA
jgi:putative peptidoglycan lipid II flippase